MAVQVGSVKRWPNWLIRLVAGAVLVVTVAAVATVIYVKSAADNSNFLVNYVNTTTNGSNASQNKQLQQFLGQLHQGRVSDCKATVQANADLFRASGINPPPQGVDAAKSECNNPQ